MKNGSCLMVVQLMHSFEPIIDGLSCVPFITDDRVELYSFSKTFDFNAAEFDCNYDTIVNSLSAMNMADFPNGFDGDSLSIDIKGDGGHSCRINVWCPHYCQDDKYHFKAVYDGFINVFETAGLLQWYMGGST
jgi:hypothetical protein